MSCILQQIYRHRGTRERERERERERDRESLKLQYKIFSSNK